MDSRGKLFKEFPQSLAPIMAKYYELEKEGFADLACKELSPADLDNLGHIHDKHLKFYCEERRMHFGAFALVGIAFIILFPALLSAEAHFLPLLGAEALLLALLVPYTFVYMRYEEGVRRMMRESMLIENARHTNSK